MTTRPFRFTTSMPRLRHPVAEWRDFVHPKDAGDLLVELVEPASG